jgi:hypothetical protein
MLWFALGRIHSFALPQPLLETVLRIAFAFRGISRWMGSSEPPMESKQYDTFNSLFSLHRFLLETTLQVDGHWAVSAGPIIIMHITWLPLDVIINAVVKD